MLPSSERVTEQDVTKDLKLRDGTGSRTGGAPPRRLAPDNKPRPFWLSTSCHFSAVRIYMCKFTIVYEGVPFYSFYCGDTPASSTFV